MKLIKAPDRGLLGPGRGVRIAEPCPVKTIRRLAAHAPDERAGPARES